MKLLNGRVVRDKIKESLKEKVRELSYTPRLEIIDIGGGEETRTYVTQKQKFGDDIGVLVQHNVFNSHTAPEEIIEYIEGLNKEEGVTGIIVQLPIPESFSTERILNTIDPQKDVDGLTDTNKKLLYEGDEPNFVPATARGVIELLDFYRITFEGKAVVVGSSDLTGKPIAKLLEQKGMQVTMCDEYTKNIPDLSKEADVLVSATGKPKLITKEYVKEGQAVVDVGYSFVDGKVVGDVDFEDVKDTVGAVTPVPGGVGPMTVAALFENLLRIEK